MKKEFVGAKYLREQLRTGCHRHKKEVCQGLVLAKIPNLDMSPSRLSLSHRIYVHNLFIYITKNPSQVSECLNPVR
jgi:hypothetical protein